MHLIPFYDPSMPFLKLGLEVIFLQRIMFCLNFMHLSRKFLHALAFSHYLSKPALDPISCQKILHGDYKQIFFCNFSEINASKMVSIDMSDFSFGHLKLQKVVFPSLHCFNFPVLW